MRGAGLDLAAEHWAAGLQLGEFRLIRPLGHGGMGVVWLAEQMVPLRREVAIKVMLPERRGALAEAWFEVERQALASLSHPSVARIFDAGRLPDGAEYLAMEYVPGLPLDRWLAQTRPDPRTLARVLIALCGGVQHAHQRGLIHRDIKPANVLVQDIDGLPLPKLIDFGVAISAAAAPAAGAARRVAGTVAYMAPEQMDPQDEGIDARADVYALGAVLAHALYRLANVVPAEDAVSSTSLREGLASSLGLATAGAPTGKDLTALRNLPAELRAVAVRAMAVDRQHRYHSAAALAEDLQRALDRQPVLAMGGGRMYRLRCFLRRHAYGSAVAALAVLALLVFAVLMTVQARRIAAEATRAQQALAELEQVSAFQSRMLETMDPQQMGAALRGELQRLQRAAGIEQPELALEVVNFTELVRSSLDQSLLQHTRRAIDAEFAAQPALQVRLLEALAETQMALGLYASAQASWRHAQGIAETTWGALDARSLSARDGMATTLQALGKLDEADALYTTTLEDRRRQLGADHPHTLDSINNLGLLRHVQARYAEAQTLYTEALAGYQRVYGSEHPSTLQAQHNLGGLLRDQGQLDAAEPLWRSVMEQRQRVLGMDHADTLSSMSSLSTLLYAQGKLDAAEPLAVEVLARARQALGDTHPITLSCIGNLATLRAAQNRPEDTATLLAEALAGAHAVWGPEHPGTQTFYANLGQLRRQQGQWDEAARLWGELLLIRRRVLGDAHPSTLALLSNYADLQRERGDAQTALRLLAAAEADARAVHVGPQQFRLGLHLARMGKAHLALGSASDLAQAARLLEEGHALSAAISGPTHAETLDMAATLARVHEHWHRLAPAAGHAALAREWQARAQPEGAPVP